MIPTYLSDGLTNSELVQFMGHVEKCESCKEELSIQFLISEGLNTLNDGGSFNLQEALDNRIARSYRYITFIRRIFWIRNVALALVALAIIACAYFGYIYVLS